MSVVTTDVSASERVIGVIDNLCFAVVTEALPEGGVAELLRDRSESGRGGDEGSE